MTTMTHRLVLARSQDAIASVFDLCPYRDVVAFVLVEPDGVRVAGKPRCQGVEFVRHLGAASIAAVLASPPPLGFVHVVVCVGDELRALLMSRHRREVGIA